jgi:hypothetical protein
MKHKFQTYLHDSFAKLVEKYGFTKSTELNEKEAYSIEYRSDTFVINLVQYWREFYVSVYKIGYPNKAVNLFNLLKFLNQASSSVPESNYFREEKDLADCYKKQFNYISDIIDESFIELNDFFKTGDYDSKMAEIEKYMINKYPDLFKRS